MSRASHVSEKKCLVDSVAGFDWRGDVHTQKMEKGAMMNDDDKYCIIKEK